jgi:hypothetical protein
MFNPTILVLQLTGNGELIIFFRETLPLFVYHFTDTDTTQYRWGDGESFNHEIAPNLIDDLIGGFVES